jgi:nitric oxide reductase large subunit
MIKPSLTNFAEFFDTPKPVTKKTQYEIQQSINWSLNIVVLLIVIIGFISLYYRFKYKTQHEEDTRYKLKQFDTYLNEYYINDMLKEENNNTT